MSPQVKATGTNGRQEPQTMTTEELLLELKQSFDRWDESIGDLKSQLSQLQESQAILCARMDKLQHSERPHDWQPLAAVYQTMGHVSIESARQALRAGDYRSGTEYQMRKRKYFINLNAIETRLLKAQLRKKAC